MSAYPNENDDTNKLNVTDKTHDLVMRWVHANAHLEKLKRELVSAECELLNASVGLGKWLVPEDFASDTYFHIWYGSGILAAKELLNSNYEIKWLKKPDDKRARELGIV